MTIVATEMIGECLMALSLLMFLGGSVLHAQDTKNALRRAKDNKEAAPVCSRWNCPRETRARYWSGRPSRPVILEPVPREPEP